MKLRSPIGCGLALFFAATMAAQSPPDPDNVSAQAALTKGATSEATPVPSASVPIEPPSLIPPNTLPGPGALPQAPISADLQLLNALFKNTTLGKIADERRFHLRMAALEVEIRNDPDLHELKAEANHAPTDLERRHRLKAYYHAYFNKLRALASTPEFKEYLTLAENTHQLGLLQPRVRHQSDEAIALALTPQHPNGASASVLPAIAATPPPLVLPHQ